MLKIETLNYNFTSKVHQKKIIKKRILKDFIQSYPTSTVEASII
jgi:hypothetical protein